MSFKRIAQTKQLPLADLTTYPANPRRGDVAAIKASLEASGQYRALLVRAGSLEVLAGNHTLLAMRELGWEKALCHLVDADDETARRIVLADNRTAELAGYDVQALADLLAQCDDLVGTGWDQGAVDELLREVRFLAKDGGGEGNGDTTEPGAMPAEPRTRAGDLWTLGEHRLFCGDAADANHVERLIGGAPSCLLTDPPYSSGGRQDSGKRNSTSIGARGAEQIARDNLTSRGYLALIGRVLGAVDAETAYLFTDWRMWSWTFDALESSGYPVRGMLVWDKEQMGMGFPWRSQHELIAFAKRSAGAINDGKHGNVLRCPRTANDLHPTQKPVELLETILGNTPGDDCYDPFAGSGSTLIACENLHRRCYAMEIDAGYVDVIVDRWQRHTGQTATLAP
ncbi:MAG: DNA methyltransferase [Solirubrobacteraceae bacterium]